MERMCVAELKIQIIFVKTCLHGHLVINLAGFHPLAWSSLGG